jgi:exodeoxyribonuclease VII small subunit
MTDSRKYSEMLKELQEIVDSLSREDCPVDELENLVQKASELIKTLKTRLSDTGKSVSAMLEEIGE